ncbi:methyltransferase domain-containing protein [Paenibacillus sp. YPG26]|uniref:class I SAM-dependent methyltransferase n=1 Tax=Paenibacillus sp. YPG26 TaxID=2878915 RepID=UPI00203D4BFE|nr:methyltransferase domain-containing protein [Paenibacillus sp. YPG26]USB33660.1 methyltransferase domain-containing protein [Paenibacillus sp. YPG26]
MINKLKLAMRMGWFMLSGKHANSSKDYDKASGDYDSFFSSTMGRHSLDLLRKMNIEPGHDVLELACGTGFITSEIARILNGQGSITTVDQSEGMLQVAREKLLPFETLKINLQQSDMMGFLKGVPDNSFDIVVCGWAICYTNPAQFMKEVHRVLKPSGQVGIIETREDSEEVLMKAFEKVISENPSYLQRYIRVELPSNDNVLKKWFVKGNLRTVDSWQGEQILPCSNSKEAIEWVLRSGAAAGFIDVIDRDRESEILSRIEKQIDQIINEERKLRLSHTYVAGIALKETS